MSDTIIIATTIFTSVYLLAFIVYLGFKQNLRLKEKQLDLETRIRMDDFRSHLERKVMDLNKEFSQSAERFDELNHLILKGQSEIKELKTAQPKQSAFLHAHGIEVIFNSITPRSIFVLMPFHTDYDEFFNAVRDVGRETNYIVSRGDEKVAKSDIFSQILRGIVTSRFIVANITGRNPNVFYELGIAHALDKEVILIAESEVKIPFDLQSKRIIFYDDANDLRAKLVIALASMSNA